MKKAMHPLIVTLTPAGLLRSPAIIAAFRAIDRADFVRPEYRNEAYLDYSLPIGSGQTISQPATVATMLELLAPRAGDRVLDVGSGSGWTTALLAHIVGNEGSVYGTERVPELVRFGSGNIARYHFLHASIHHAQPTLGLPDQAPFDRILVSAASNTIPEELLDQLRPGGTMVLPVHTSVVRIEKHFDASLALKELPGFAFVPLVR